MGQRRGRAAQRGTPSTAPIVMTVHTLPANNRSTKWIRSPVAYQAPSPFCRRQATRLGHILGTPCIAGHIINGRMDGGVGTKKNIVPITQSMNRRHTKIENVATEALETGLLNIRNTRGGRPRSLPIHSLKYSMRVWDFDTVDGPGGTVHNLPHRFKQRLQYRTTARGPIREYPGIKTLIQTYDGF